jgi:hypothetical protein
MAGKTVIHLGAYLRRRSAIKRKITLGIHTASRAGSPALMEAVVDTRMKRI